MPKYLTIDVGGTNIKYAVMTEEAEILEKGEYPTPRTNLDDFLASLKELYEKYRGQVEAVAMSAPGRIDATTSYFYTSGALGYISGINLGEKVKSFIDVPFSVENDAKAAALAELWKGSMRGVSTGSVIVIGTGIGGAVIVDGRLHRGATFAAGEYSCLPMHLDRPYDGTNWAKQNGVYGLLGIYAEKIGTDKAELDGRILFNHANAGEKEAIEAIEEFCRGLVIGIWSLQVVLDCEKIAIGGGISKQPLLMEILNRELDEDIARIKDRVPFSRPEVVLCQFGNDANMIGALYHYLYELNA